jgi:hypothetical protein
MQRVVPHHVECWAPRTRETQSHQGPQASDSPDCPALRPCDARALVACVVSVLRPRLGAASVHPCAQPLTMHLQDFFHSATCKSCEQAACS